MLKLYCFDRSPFGWKTRITLAHKKVPHEMIVPQNKNEDPEFGKLNPFRLTPVLVLPDGRSIYESSVVNEYLEDAYPEPPMLPKDPFARARVRMIEDTTDQYVLPAVRDLMLARFDYKPPKLIRRKPGEVDAGAVDAAQANVRWHLARLEADLHPGPWFGGTIFSLADAALVAPLTLTLPLIEVLPDPKYPRIAAWTQRVAALPAYQASRPQEPPQIEG
jgi:glutathione S-transferase